MLLREVGLPVEEQISEINSININKNSHSNTLSSGEVVFKILEHLNAWVLYSAS
jgi:hypothetical protein